ncbi:MAG: GTP 3',8-cyclase MoaA [Chloroflexota bacterium]
MGCINDAFNRPINYLRISVTDRCNLRCLYCMPAEGVQACKHEDLLTYEEIELVVRAAASLGLSKVRLTGGEPLVRANFTDLVRKIAAVPGIDDLAATTNGVMLAAKAADLAAAGLKRVNVSLDTLRPERFAQLTRVDALPRVLEGIEAAQAAGLRPVKINTVVVRGFNDDEVADLARTTLERDWHVRFIELMPLGESEAWKDNGYVPTSEVRALVEVLGQLEAADGAAPRAGNGPARYYRLPGARGTIGFISPVSEHFCFQCNRLRLTADGRLRPCLLRQDEVDLRAALRAGAGVEEIAEFIREAVRLKPEGHRLVEHELPRGRTMSQIGG